MKTNEAKSMIFPSLHQSVSESSNLLLPESKSKDSIKEELRVEREKRTCPTLRFELSESQSDVLLGYIRQNSFLPKFKN